MGEVDFSRGAEVEVSSDEEGFRGAWFAATVIRSASKKKKLLVEYQSLMADEKGSKPLREFIDAVHVRPRPPRELDPSFKKSEEVDAFCNDGWWEGIIINVLENSRFSVFFRGSREQIEFGISELRLHREWVDGSWVPPLEEQSKSSKTEAKCNKRALKVKCSKGKSVVKLSKGTLVEVSSDEEGFQGAWFAATIIKTIGKDKFLVEYQSLKTDDETEPLREEVDTLHIRPFPPELPKVDCLSLFEEVDALCNDGWWVGVIAKVLSNSRYIVYFRKTKEEMELGHSELRPHQDCIGGKWVRASQV
ncbi:hypothetical protein HHK36_012215 [Tetracentron sinense]|uniref:Agenet domain-containing protein n=1 Tax=Tetracentron sinense TaxID=13715 RepID=A0A835DHW0_TETSI|nr:hypothetical protein HHK36_012215 [Tetracentron sinense]